MRVRPARDGDREFVVRLAHRFAEFTLPEWLTARGVTEGTAAQLARALDDQHQRSAVLIAQDDRGEPLGFAWVLLVADFYGGPDVAKISEIAVGEDGTGAGSALMEACEAWARARGCSRIVLNVMEGNARARRFYERHGFAPEYTMLVKPIAAEEDAGTPG
ncbi:MAG TPA: GNAT family N-acetyltransferase [Candidatus Aquilonibacter sp.]|nr:GNAT family N-acetyltransferase [Candidatus Aquilonibacter sp.]